MSLTFPILYILSIPVSVVAAHDLADGAVVESVRLADGLLDRLVTGGGVEVGEVAVQIKTLSKDGKIRVLSGA